MNLLLKNILFFVFVINVAGKSVQGNDIPELKWRNKYTLEAEKLHLVSGLVEHIKYWRSPKISRVDYNHGAVKTISVTPEIDNLKDFGIKYEIHPETMEEYNNEIICYYTNGSVRNPIEVAEMLPPASQFQFVGKEMLGSGEVSKFAKINKDDFMINEERTYIWVSLNENKTYWVPVKIEEFMYNIWLGKMASHYIWNIINYEEDYDDIAFSVEQYNCTENPELEEDNLPRYDDDGSNVHVDNAFARFINNYERKYDDKTEHVMRRKIFAENLRFVRSHNQKNTNFKLGINKFSDRTPSEVKKMKGLRRRKVGEIGTVPFPYNDTQIDELSKKIPKQFDSRLLGVITPVEDQDTCGACWAFGTTSAVEGALARKNGGRLFRLANQALIDCAWEFGGYGCNGGSDTAAYKWTMKYGLPTVEEYGPYSNNNDICRITNMTKRYRIKGFTDVPRFNIKALKLALLEHGPLTVSMDATDYMRFYTSGIIFDNTCDINALNHEVNLVGYGNRGGAEYWIVKNSWGRDWGIDGYFHISTRNFNCGITTEPTYVVV